MVFGRKKKKIEFDARKKLPKEIESGINKWEYIHNFKVHYKSSGIQIFASKLDLSISSNSPKLPSHQEVKMNADERIKGSTLTLTKGKKKLLSTPLGRLGKKDLAFSYHITNLEYRESIAFLKGCW